MEQLTKRAAHFVAHRQQLDSEKEAVIAYGMLALSQMLVILLFAVVWGLLTGTFWECVIVYIAVGALRKSTGGAHARTMAGCILMSVTTMSTMAVVSRYVLAPRLTPWLMLVLTAVLYTLCFLIVWKKAPVDSPNKPIRNPEKVKRLRKSSFLLLAAFCGISLLLAILTFYIDSATFMINSADLYSVNCALVLALGWQSLTLTKIIHLLFP